MAADEEPAWIERIADLAAAIGMNRVRVRWRLARWHERRRAASRRREQFVQHVGYEHKTCAECGAVQDRDEKTCSRCGARLSARHWQVLRRLGMAMPQVSSFSFLLGTAIVIVYGRTMLASATGVAGITSGIDVDTLYRFGGHWPPAVAQGEWWRLATSVFLHGGLLHLGFNLYSLTVIGPHTEEVYGRLEMLFLFLLTGVVANVGCQLVGLDGIGIGASGGLMGLIGVAAGYGQRDGTLRGRNLRNDMLKWAAYVIFFGFFIRANNWAHAFGLLSGAIIGFAVRPRWLASGVGRVAARVCGAIGLLGCVATCALILIEPSPSFEEARDREAAEFIRAAVNEVKAECAATPPSQEACQALEEIRRGCREDTFPLEGDDDGLVDPAQMKRLRRVWRAQCDGL